MIDCHSLYPPLERESIFADFCGREMDVILTFSSEIMTAIDTIVAKSRGIPLDIKRRILPSAV